MCQEQPKAMFASLSCLDGCFHVGVGLVVSKKTNAAAPVARRSFRSLPERSAIMHTRIIDITSKEGKSCELCSTIEDKVLPILKKQHFVDELVMVSENDPNHLIVQSFWKSRDAAERYVREQYESVLKIVLPLLDNLPTIRTFGVHISTAHRVTAAKSEKTG
jgi:quinol monooxygenase YgiN